MTQRMSAADTVDQAMESYITASWPSSTTHWKRNMNTDDDKLSLASCDCMTHRRTAQLGQVSLNEKGLQWNVLEPRYWCYDCSL